MALQFQPPEWLIREYMNRKSAPEQVSEGIQNAMQTYATMDQARKQNELTQQTLALKKAESERAGRESFYKYGDPSGLPASEQTMLNPVQGPVADGELTENLAPSYDPNNPAAFATSDFLRSFKQKFPQGAEGAKIQKDLVNVPNTLDEITARQVREGKLSIEDAYKMKQADSFGGAPKTIEAALMGQVKAGTMTLDDAIAKAAQSKGLATESTSQAKNKVKIEAEKPKASASLKNTLREYDNMIAEAKAIRDDSALGAATGATSFTGSIPGTPTKRVAARLDTLKAKTLLNVLAAMKDLSSTGASGFGALSEIEGENIRNSVSTLDRGLQTGDFKASIDRFINEMESKKGVLAKTYADTYGETPSSSESTSITSKAEYDALPSGSTYTWNGETRRKK